MNEDDRAANKALYEEVGRILWEIWDSIGVRAMGSPSEEYDSYRAGVVRLAKSGASERSLLAHLLGIEETPMEISGGPGAVAAAGALAALSRR